MKVFTGARETAVSPGSPEILVHHGSPDAPAVDVEEVGVGAGTIINNLEYPSYTGYTNFMLADYILQVKDSTSSVTVGEYQAPLQTLNLGDSAFVLMASGFLNNINNPGPGFGLFAVMPSGQVIELPQNTASVQVIHNSPDPAASSVAVWVNTNKVLDSVPFRFASPYLPVPANADVDVSITPAGATDLSSAVLTKTFNLMADTSYVVVATGVTNNPALFDSVQPLRSGSQPGSYDGHYFR
ncbi:MAG: DUF4397 domain-containing protein [Owenweeksia sp.]|nr:DUF4397 domain-containing protein [Owenweeksia sp.]